MHFELQYVIFIWAKTTKKEKRKKRGKEGMNKLCSINCELETRLTLVTTSFDLTLMSSYRAALAQHAFKSVRSFCFVNSSTVLFCLSKTQKCI